MPFKSKAQARLFWAKANRGEMPRKTAEEWARATPSIKSLPERVTSKLSASTSSRPAPKKAPTRAAAFTPLPRPLTLPRASGNRWARRGVPRSKTRGYGRNF